MGRGRWSIELIDVYLRVDGRRVLSGLNLGAEAGEITAVLGPTGAGKTALFRMLVGLERPDHGAVIVAGHDVARLGGRKLQKLRGRMSVMFQGGKDFGCGLFESATVFENVAFPLRSRRRRGADRLAGEYLARTGLGGKARMTPDALAADERKLLALARALAPSAPLAILDDFDRGIDPARLRGVCELIRAERRAHASTVLVTTRDHEAARLVADRVVLLDGGRAVESATIAPASRAASPISAT